MGRLSGRRKHIGDAGKAAVVAALCLVLATPPGFAEGPVAAGTTGNPTPVHKFYPLTDEQKTLHALNRLTFGPRPGDVEMVNKMGLEAWFERQLHPETIDDSKLEARLDLYPGLKLSREDVMDAFPTPLMIRQKADRQVGFPADPVEYAIYSDLIAKYFDVRKEDASIPKKLRNKDMEAENDAAMESAGAAVLVQPETATAESLQQQWAVEEPDPHGFKTKEQMAAIADKRSLIPPLAKADVDAVLELEPDARFERLVAMNPLEMVALRKVLSYDRVAALIVGMQPAQAEAVRAMGGPLQTIKTETAEARMDRDVYSERQLQAVMVDFWLNHFSVYTDKSEKEPYLLPSYEREAILPYAMGHFEEMLVATAKSPAMLMYLDQSESVGPDSTMVVNRHHKSADSKGINENYARELLELHTYGVRCEVSAEHPAKTLDASCAGGYTQQDVIEVARCFTGWTIDKPGSGGNGNAVYDPARHEPGPKHVLGRTISESGQDEAMQVLHILATSPATATFLSSKLAARFVSDAPPPALVARMADTYLKTGGDIRAVLSTMFHSPEFWAPDVYRAKLKTPIEFVASVVRASGAQVQNPDVLVHEVKDLGMPIYGKETPNGYSWAASEWVSSNALVSRMNFALVFSNGRLAGTHTKWHTLLGYADDSPLIATPTPKTELALETIILGQPAAEQTRTSVMSEFEDPALQVALGRGPREATKASALTAGGQGPPINTMAGLLLGSPDFQRR